MQLDIRTIKYFEITCVPAGVAFARLVIYNLPSYTQWRALGHPATDGNPLGLKPEFSERTPRQL